MHARAKGTVTLLESISCGDLEERHAMAKEGELFVRGAFNLEVKKKPQAFAASAVGP
jgi:hypothetical protein